MTEIEHERPIFVKALLLLLVVGAYHYALYRADGFFDLPAIELLCVLLIILLAIMILPFKQVVERRHEFVLLLAGLGVIGFQVSCLIRPEWFRSHLNITGWLHADSIPAAWIKPPELSRHPFHVMTCAAGGLGVLAVLIGRTAWRWVALVGLLGLHFAMSCWVIEHTPKPKIDVWMFQQDGPKAFLVGMNPYGITFENIYGDTAVYSKEVIRGHRILFGFPYPPLSLLMIMPAVIAMDECRYAHALCWVITGALVAGIRPGRWSTMAAVIMLLNPMLWRVVEASWTESLFIPFMAATVLCAVRFPKLTPVMLGLLLCSKQYFVVMLPITLLLVPRPWTVRAIATFYLVTFLTGALVTLPLAMWDWAAFWHSNITIQIKQPFRPDSISVLAWVFNASPKSVTDSWNNTIPSPWDKLAFMLAAVSWVVVFWKSSRSAYGFAMGMALVSMVFFLFNRQSFLNYHTFTTSCMVLGMATLSDRAFPNQAKTADLRLL